MDTGYTAAPSFASSIGCWRPTTFTAFPSPTLGRRRAPPVEDGWVTLAGHSKPTYCEGPAAVHRRRLGSVVVRVTAGRLTGLARTERSSSEAARSRSTWRTAECTRSSFGVRSHWRNILRNVWPGRHGKSRCARSARRSSGGWSSQMAWGECVGLLCRRSLTLVGWRHLEAPEKPYDLYALLEIDPTSSRSSKAQNFVLPGEPSSSIFVAVALHFRRGHAGSHFEV